MRFTSVVKLMSASYVKYEVMCEMTGSWLVIKDAIILDFKRASVHVSTSLPSSEKEDCFKQIHRDYSNQIPQRSIIRVSCCSKDFWEKDLGSLVKMGNGRQSKLDTYGITEANTMEKQKERCSHHRHTVFRFFAQWLVGTWMFSDFCCHEHYRHNLNMSLWKMPHKF